MTSGKGNARPGTSASTRYARQKEIAITNEYECKHTIFWVSLMVCSLKMKTVTSNVLPDYGTIIMLPLLITNYRHPCTHSHQWKETEQHGTWKRLEGTEWKNGMEEWNEWNGTETETGISESVMENPVVVYRPKPYCCHQGGSGKPYATVEK